MLKFLGLQNPSLKIGENILPSSKWTHFISLAFLQNRQQRRPFSFCHSGFSNRKCYATMGCVSVQVKLPVAFFHLSRPTTLQRFKKHDLPIRCFSAATPHEWEHGKCLPSNPTTKPLEITIHHSSQLLYVELLRLPMGKSIKKAHPCPSSISGLRIFGHHQNKGRFFSEGNNISRYLEYWNTSFTMSMSKTKPCLITRTVVLWISCACFWDSWCQRRKHLLNDLWNTRSRV